MGTDNFKIFRAELEDKKRSILSTTLLSNSASRVGGHAHWMPGRLVLGVVCVPPLSGPTRLKVPISVCVSHPL